jgi:hypothetical protein
VRVLRGHKIVAELGTPDAVRTDRGEEKRREAMDREGVRWRDRERPVEGVDALEDRGKDSTPDINEWSKSSEVFHGEELSCCPYL